MYSVALSTNDKQPGSITFALVYFENKHNKSCASRILDDWLKLPFVFLFSGHKYGTYMCVWSHVRAHLPNV